MNAPHKLPRDRVGDIFRQWIDGEEWRPIPSMDGYEVSNIGRVRSWKSGEPRNLCLGLTHDGYLFAALRVNGRQKSFYIQRLVCTAWNGEQPSPDHQVAHLDGDSINNAPDNLAWVMPVENCAHKHLHGTHLRGSQVASAKLTEDQVRQIKLALASGEMGTAIARRFGVNGDTISDIRKRRTWAWLEEPAA